MVDLKEKMKTNSKQKKKNKKASGAGEAALAAVEFETEAATNGHKATTEGLSGDEEEEETTANGTASAGNKSDRKTAQRDYKCQDLTCFLLNSSYGHP